MNRKLIQVAIAFLFLIGLAWLTFNEPLTPDADDCAARGRPATCWRAFEFAAPDVRSEPKP